MRTDARVFPAMLLALAVFGCGGNAPGRASRAEGETLAVTVLADSAEDASLPPAAAGVAPPPRLTLLRVAAARDHLAAPLPEPEPAVPEAEEAPPAPAGDDVLRPPLPRGAALVRLPAARRGWLELDVRVDERGEVSDAIPVGGDADSATVRAAVEAAFATRWYPATRRGAPVAVWCRQRFEAGPAR